MMRDALNRTGKPITYAIDDWGVTNTWNYGQEVCPSSVNHVVCWSSNHTPPLMAALPGLRALPKSSTALRDVLLGD